MPGSFPGYLGPTFEKVLDSFLPGCVLNSAGWGSDRREQRKQSHYSYSAESNKWRKEDISLFAQTPPPTVPVIEIYINQELIYSEKEGSMANI